MGKAVWFMAGAAAALIAVAPASAQRARTGPVTGGSGRHHAAPGHGHVGGPLTGFDRRRRCGGYNPVCNKAPVIDLGWGYGGLIEDPEYASRDQGFFSGPAEVLAANGGAYYDYDRAYPYDWYHDPAEAAPVARFVGAGGPAMRCDVSWVAGRGGERSPVRVCRGRR